MGVRTTIRNKLWRAPSHPKTGCCEWYYYHARLAENMGVRAFRLLLMIGLERELGKMVGHSECEVM